MTSSMLSATAPPLTSNYSKKLIALDPYSLSKRSSLNTPFIHKTLSLRHRNIPSHFVKLCYATDSSSSRIQGEGKESETVNADGTESGLTVEVGNPNRLTFIPTARLSLGDQAFFLLSFIACTTSIAFTSLVIAAVPTLFAMGRAATSLAKLADTAREELPSTMAAIRLSGMEISDLTLELSDLSQEIADGVNKSTQAVQVAEAGIRQIGTRARQQTMSMIEERANLPVISLQPAVVGAAKKTSYAVGRATKNLIYFLSRGEFSSKSEDDSTDRLGL